MVGPNTTDLSYAAMEWEWQRAVCRPLSGPLGVPPGTVLFTLALFASLPIGAGFRFIESPVLKNLYGLLAGTFLSVFAFGSATASVFVFGAASYAAMAAHRKRCGAIVGVGAFAYLIYFHATSSSGEAWKAGNIDITGLLMVLTLKVTACALNYQDAAAPLDRLSDFQKRRAVTTLPNPLDYAAWLVFPCTLVVGPALEFRDYSDWLRGKGVWDKNHRNGGCPSVFVQAMKTAAYATFFMTIHLYVATIYTIDDTYLSPDWNSKPLWLKFWELHILGQGSRGKYFFCWVWAEAACVASGIGFSGHEEKKVVDKKSGEVATTRVATWETGKNVRPMGVETAATFVQIPHHWNIQTGKWLRHYVYDRSTPAGKKPGFRQLLLTQTVSGVWHGLYAGYWLFFVSSAVFIEGSKSVYRWQSKHWLFSRAPASWLISLPHWLLATVGLNYLCGAFMLVTFRQCVDAWASVYFLPHLVVVAMVIFGRVVNPKKKRDRGDASAKANASGAVGLGAEEKKKAN